MHLYQRAYIPFNNIRDRVLSNLAGYGGFGSIYCIYDRRFLHIYRPPTACINVCDIIASAKAGHCQDHLEVRSLIQVQCASNMQYQSSYMVCVAGKPLSTATVVEYI